MVFRAIVDLVRPADVEGFRGYCGEVISQGSAGGRSAFDERAREFKIRPDRAQTLLGESLVTELSGCDGIEEFEAANQKAERIKAELDMDPGHLSEARGTAGARIMASHYREMVERNAFSKPALGELGDRLGMTGPDIVAAIGTVAGEYFKQTLDAVLEDGRVTDDEDRQLDDLQRRLGIDTLDIGNFAGLLQKGREMFRAESAPMPIAATAVLLQGGELCHFAVVSEALETRERTVRVNYGGPTASIRIMKGLSYRVGSVAVDRQKETYTHSHGFGELVLTNKRVIWVGPNKTVSIRFPSIIAIEPFRDGLEVRKSSGKPMTFVYDEDPCLAILAVRAIQLQGMPLI